ncbi:MAG: enoyl-CoA hydratase-related protein [Myxococcota bacterium]
MDTIHEIMLPAALSPESLGELRGQLEVPLQGVLVLRGGPERFCTGLDLGGLEELPRQSQSFALQDFMACLMTLRRAAVPVVALVEGVALGGGLGLAAAADYVLASPSARFGLPEVLFGLSPAMILPILEERMTAQRVRRLGLAGASIDASAAQAWGLVDEIADPPADALSRVVRSYRRASSVGVQELKRHPHDVGRLTWGIEQGMRITQEALDDPTVRARLRRFLESEGLPWD